METQPELKKKYVKMNIKLDAREDNGRRVTVALKHGTYTTE